MVCGVWECAPFCSPFLSLCLLLQHCWFRVVSLWNGGGVMGGFVSVYFLFFVFFSFLFFSLFVGVRGSARAALRART